MERLAAAAARMGAAFGVTRPVAMNAWAGPDRQIGVSGTRTAPAVCIVAGASGAPAFLWGVERAGFIAAVDTDDRAAIVGESDASVVDDAVAGPRGARRHRRRAGDRLMRPLLLNLTTSLDGFIADKDEGTDWIQPPPQEPAAAYPADYHELMVALGTHVMGDVIHGVAGGVAGASVITGGVSDERHGWRSSHRSRRATEYMGARPRGTAGLAARLHPSYGQSGRFVSPQAEDCSLLRLTERTSD